MQLEVSESSHLSLCIFSLLVQLSDLLSQTPLSILVRIQRVFKLSSQVLQLRLDNSHCVLENRDTQFSQLNDTHMNKENDQSQYDRTLSCSCLLSASLRVRSSSMQAVARSCCRPASFSVRAAFSASFWDKAFSQHTVRSGSFRL